MYIIRERRNYKETVYEKWIVNNKSEQILLKKVKVKSVEVSDDKGTQYFLLYNSRMELISDAFKFINIKMVKHSPNSKEKAVYTLKQLFAFAELFNLDYKKINEKQAEEFKQFLYGGTKNGAIYEINIETQRGADTINEYLGYCRKFYEFLKIKDSSFHQINTVIEKSGTGFMAHANKNTVVEYKLNDKSQYDNHKVPMYIKPFELKRILEVIRKEYSIREEIIVRLMYECGLRLGEVLGLTLEDITTSPEDICNKNKDELGKLIIRNRVSDNKWQLAKGCIIPGGFEDYKNDFYNKENVGYEVAKPTISLLSIIEEYISNEHGHMTTRRRKNYLAYSKADMVTDGKNLSGDNYYLFLNKNGAPLAKSGWNKIIRVIFLKTGLKVDKKERKHNLNHRFRHGYAMYLKKYHNYKEVDLMHALRHKSILSVAIYFRPDDDDLYEANKQSTEGMYKLIPELRI
ncbi:MAG: tyrosine-type recombinase/integrase [Solirubrobacterales bacterium]